MKRNLPLYLSAAAFTALVLLSPRAAEGARHGLAVCAGTLVPSLLPFFVLSKLMGLLGLTDLLSGLAGKPLQHLFHVSGAGAQAFLIGLSGGYPLGASVTADLRRKGLVSRREAERLLAFCNNSGPAFILGAAGGVFRSRSAGLLLFAAHVLAAVCTGLVLRGSHAGDIGEAQLPQEPQEPRELPGFGEALPEAVSGALAATLSVCAYVVLFSALLACLPFPAALPPLLRVLAAGFVELGSGITALAGTAPAPASLAAAAFLLGWGGLSVHAQTLGAVAGTDIKCARHLAGRALCGVFAAIFAYAGGMLFF